MTTMLLSMVTVAWAFGCPQPMTATEVDSVVGEARTAVDNDDVAGFRRHYVRFGERVRCLQEPLPRQPWAELLVLDAIVRFAEGEAVDHRLQTARLIWPRVSIPGFLPSAAPAPTAPPGRTAPPGLYVDGSEVSTVPDLKGDHVVQRVQDDVWETVFSSQVPRGWAGSGTDGSTTKPLWSVRAGAGPGFAHASPRAGDPGAVLPDAQGGGPGVLVTAAIETTGSGPNGFGRLQVPLWLGQVGVGSARIPVSLHAGGTVPAGPARVELGALFALTPLRTGDTRVERVDLLPTLGVAHQGTLLDAGLTVAAWLDSLRLRGRFGLTLSNGLRAGLLLDLHRRAFTQGLDDLGVERDLLHQSWAGALTVGGSWGP
jgi:hypothetical protein